MASMAFTRALLGLLLALAPGAMAYSQCSQVPYVGNVDQSPSDPNMYGKCSGSLEGFVKGMSHWCKFNDLGMWPSGPSDKAKRCLKFGRTTIYRGPIYGSSPAHKAACNKWLHGDDKFAMVAVSTKYLKTYQGGWAGDKGACGKCMCVRLHGGDDKFNTGLQRDSVSKHIGLTFLAKVGDRCGECEDDHIDLLQDRPLTFAPFDPKNDQNNYWAPYVNAKDGLRGFSDPNYMRGTQYSVENPGTWTTDWQWVPCNSFGHGKCANLMKKMGYDNVWTPKKSEGVDSWSLRPVSEQRTANKRLWQKPWA